MNTNYAHFPATIQDPSINVFSYTCAFSCFRKWKYLLGKIINLFFTPIFAGRQYIKDVLVDGQSHLLIIREETELPGAQVS